MKFLVLASTILVVLALVTGCASPETVAPPATETPSAVGISNSPRESTATVLPSTTTTTQAPPSDFEVKGTVEAVDFAYDSQKIENGVFTGTGTDVRGYHGDLEGELTMKFTAVHDLSGTFYTKVGEATFRGTVNGKSGTFTATDNSSGQAFSPGTAIVDCRYTIISGTGELSNLRGKILASESIDAPNLSGEYSGVLAFGFEPTRLPVPPPPAQPPEPKPAPATPEPLIEGTIERISTIDTSSSVLEGTKVTTDRTDTWEVHGTLEGTWVRQLTSSIDLNTIPREISGHGEATFTGMVNGKQGTFTASEVFVGHGESSGNYEVKATITGGTGELADVSGTITVSVEYNAQEQKGTYTTSLNFGEAGASYTWQEATKHIYETATVTGPVIDWLDIPFPDGRTDPVLGMGVAPLEPGAFNIRLMVDREFLPEDLYVGKVISVTGEIGPNVLSGARIWVNNLSQIVVEEE